MAGDPRASRASAALSPAFQSAPAIDGGRSARLFPRPRRPAGFNPRPPSMAGDPPCHWPGGTCWRCFNPRPPSMAGDPRVRTSVDVAHGGFNPRPPSMAGDPRTGWPRGRRWCRFNPRPPSMAGDPSTSTYQPSRMAGFQSAPAIDGGRSVPGHDAADRHADVSIRARHRWRAIRARASCSRWHRCVSIRARHRWRAIRVRSICFWWSRRVSIRARHRWRAIRRRTHQHSSDNMFQSAPAIDGGRSNVSASAAKPTAVSIRARHRWRAIPV